MKKEMTEEAAENYANIFTYPEDSDPYLDFINGAKWQQERSYSDMQEYAEHSIECFKLGEDCLFAKEWFEHFKKK